jgi:hypothetical protein
MLVSFPKLFTLVEAAEACELFARVGCFHDFHLRVTPKNLQLSVRLQTSLPQFQFDLNEVNARAENKEAATNP